MDSQPQTTAGHTAENVATLKQQIEEWLTSLKSFNLTDEIRGVTMHLNEAVGLLETEANKFVVQSEQQANQVISNAEDKVEGAPVPGSAEAALANAPSNINTTAQPQVEAPAPTPPTPQPEQPAAPVAPPVSQSNPIQIPVTDGSEPTDQSTQAQDNPTAAPVQE